MKLYEIRDAHHSNTHINTHSHTFTHSDIDTDAVVGTYDGRDSTSKRVSISVSVSGEYQCRARGRHPSRLSIRLCGGGSSGQGKQGGHMHCAATTDIQYSYAAADTGWDAYRCRRY